MALTLETNLAFYGPYGTEGGEYFELPAIDGKIIGFHARYEKYVNAVGVYVQVSSALTFLLNYFGIFFYIFVVDRVFCVY